MFNLIRIVFSGRFHFFFFSLLNCSSSIACLDLRRHEFESLHASLIVHLEQFNLGKLRAQIVCLSDRLEDFKDVVEFFV